MNSYTPLESAGQNIFKDAVLSPGEINSLLGVRVTLELDDETASEEERRRVRAYHMRIMVLIAFMTLILTAGATTATMYQLKIGPFYDSETLASTKD